MAASPPSACWVSEGTFCASEEIRSGSPTRLSEAWSTNWTGAALSTALRPVWRVPVTITSCPSASTAEVAGGAVWAEAGTESSAATDAPVISIRILIEAPFAFALDFGRHFPG